ncbi:MAG: S41 family peptidase [Prevotellaceae bacterium]|nr:S41 family peptidase [Prevotellaceae bacterium]
MNDERRQSTGSRLTPLLMALCVILGILIGTFYANHFAGNRLSIISTGNNKINYLLQMIDQNYVDTVDMNDLVEQAMPQILSELDPHSSYISARDAEEASEDLKGSFSGVGISFSMQSDTATIMSIVKGGPSEKVGIMPGDRIVSANGLSLVGMDADSVKTHLKGEKGSTVRLDIARRGHKDLLHFSVVRGDVPVNSLDAAYMIDKQTGYVCVRSFGDHTYEEFMVALAKLNTEGMKQLIVDLRGNRGGYMHIAIQMVNEFLPKGRLIVYTEGRKSPREEYRSDGHGTFKQLPIVVLVDEGSASASEIFAGAIQDNDRGTIIGRRSFGKGLVQQPMEFKDGSVVRLTIARYYSPSGRCIQKAYENGHGEDYENELIARYERGEYFTADSIKQEGEAYKTSLGRTVYGGGGITPDIFVPEDTSDVTSYYKEAVFSGYVRQFAFNYSDTQRQKLGQFPSWRQMEKYLVAQKLPEQFAAYAEGLGLKRRNLMLQRSHTLFERAIIGAIIYNILDMEDYQEYLNTADPTVLKAQDILKEGKSFPTAPED